MSSLVTLHIGVSPKFAVLLIVSENVCRETVIIISSVGAA